MFDQIQNSGSQFYLFCCECFTVLEDIRIEVVQEDVIGANIEVVQEVVNEGDEVDWKIIVRPIAELFHTSGWCISDHGRQVLQIRLAPYICIVLGAGGVKVVNGVGTLWLDGCDVRLWDGGGDGGFLRTGRDWWVPVNGS